MLTGGLGARSVLVTGGAGFLGSALSAACARRGAQVVSLDVAAPVRVHDAAVEVIQGDVRDAALVDELVSRAGLVLHFAAIANVHRYIESPSAVLDTNWNGTQNVLQACLRHGRPVMLASTSEIFGRNGDLLAEDSACILGPPSVPRWCYATSKLAAEHLAFGLASQGLVFTVVRYFNVYGPLLDSPGTGRVLAKFLGALQSGQPLELIDGGHAIRSFCYVDDAVEATLRLVEGLAEGHAAWVGRAVHVGRHEPVTVRRVAEIVTRQSGQPHGFREISGRDAMGSGFEDIPARIPDLSFVESATGFRAAVSLEAGIARTLDHWGLLRHKPVEAPAPIGQLPMVRPIFEATDELATTFRRSLRAGRVTNEGPLVLQFEQSLAAYLGTPDAVVLSSGGMALMLVAQVLGLRGRVVLPSFTYLATAAAFVQRGLEPIFCDVDPDTFTMSAADVASVLADHTGVAAVVPVNVFGVPPDWSALAAPLARSGATLLYDNAHGFGSEADGARLPTMPFAQVFSLHATKTLPAIEGGVVSGGDPAFLKEVRRLRGHGIAAPLTASSPGYNLRMDELRAAVGMHMLARFPEALRRRQSYGHRLTEFLARECDGLFRPQTIPPSISTNYQNFGVRLTRRAPIEAVIASLRDQGIEGRRYFWPPLHHLDMWRGGRALPGTDAIERTLLCLPLYSRMTESELQHEEEALKRTAELFSE